MSKFLDNLKKGNVEFTIPDSWSMKKAGRITIGLLLFSVAFGIVSIVENNFLLVSLCIFSAFIAGQIYFVFNHWNMLKTTKVNIEKCIFLEKMEYGLFCTKGFPTVYVRTSNDKFEPCCNGCKRKTVLR